MNKWLNNYFSFTKREYNALLALFGLLIFAIVTPYLYDQFFLKEEIMTDFERNAIQELILVDKNKSYNYSDQLNTSKENRLPSKATLFVFDPNQINLEGWQKLGLSAKQAQSILNYRAKGGKFYKTEDLQKMYAISPKLFEKLKPFVAIAAPEKKDWRNTAHEKTVFKKEPVNIDINRADTNQLDQIKGVGAAFARRIVKYRDRLGGFVKKEQLMEVYGLDSIKFEEIKSQIQIDISAVKKININTASFEDLKNHPYLKYKQINAILQYRKQHGEYSSIADLKKLLILTPQTIGQLIPYLQF